MKKLISLFIFMCFIVTTYAQDDLFEDTGDDDLLKNKKGFVIPPEQGDIAIAVEASPFLQFIGNMFNGDTNNNSPSANFIDNEGDIMVKYFLDDNRAIRVRFEYDYSNSLTKRYVDDDAKLYEDPLSNAQVIDSRNSLESDLAIGLEYELRRSHGRLHGYYGAGAYVMYGNEKSSFSYGNTYSELFPNPTFYDFGSNDLGDGMRILESEDGGYWGIGVKPFIGVEYFFMPKVAIGAELGWRVAFSKSGKSKRVYEYWDGNQSLEMTEMLSPGGRTFSAHDQNPSANLYLIFHF